jgi:hypothetical protein
MKMRFLVLLVCVTVAAIGLHAHGGEEHVMGTVTKVTDAAIIVKTAKGSATVAVASTTKFIKGKTAAKVSDLNVGDRVVIHAIEGADEKLTADTVEFGATTKTGPAQPAAAQPPKPKN